MKQLSIIVLAALALALVPVPEALAQNTCETYFLSNPYRIIMEAKNKIVGCVGNISVTANKTMIGYKMEITSRPGSLKVNGEIAARMTDGGFWYAYPSAPPTAEFSMSPMPLKEASEMTLKMFIPDVDGPFSGVITVFLADAVPTPTIPGGSGSCGPGDFHCSHSGVGYKTEMSDLTIGGSAEGGRHEERYPLGTHFAEPGAWKLRVWGCGSMGGSNQALSVTVASDDNGGRDLFPAINLQGSIQTQIATQGIVFHVPMPRDEEVYSDPLSRSAYLVLRTGSAWAPYEKRFCNMTLEKIANNNLTTLPNGTKRLTVYSGAYAWWPGGNWLVYWRHFPPAASTATTQITLDHDDTWQTINPGFVGVQCRAGAANLLLNAEGTGTLNMAAGADFYCAHLGNQFHTRLVIDIGPYLAGPTMTPTASRTVTVSPTPSNTRTLAPAYTRTPTQPTNTRTNTLTPSQTNTASPSVTGTRPVDAPCALSVTHGIPVAPGTATIKLSLGIQFVVADNPVYVNMSTAIEIAPGTYTWSEQTADYTFYSLTGPARLLVCTATAATQTATASRTITQIAQGEEEYCFPATPIPIDDVNPMLPDLGLIMPTWTATIVITMTMTPVTSTINISVTAIIGLITTVETGIISPAARIQTAVAPYSWESGESTGASWAARLDPVLQWLAILNPDNPAWSTAGGPLWALSPVLIYILPIVIVLLGVALIQFVLWLARLLLAALQLVMQVIETITP